MAEVDVGFAAAIECLACCEDGVMGFDDVEEEIAESRSRTVGALRSRLIPSSSMISRISVKVRSGRTSVPGVSVSGVVISISRFSWVWRNRFLLWPCGRPRFRP